MFLGANALFESLDQEQWDAVAILLCNTIDNTLLAVFESSGTKEAQQMMELLKKKCSRTERQHKLVITDRMLEVLNDRSGADDAWIATWHKVIADFKHVEVTVDKLYGLLMQATITAPIGINKNNFEYAIGQSLNDATTPPTFTEVSTIIQTCSNKLKAQSQLPTGTFPSDVEMAVQAVKH